jgi:hemerythrin
MSYINFTKKDYVKVAVIDKQHHNIAVVLNDIHSNINSDDTALIKDLIFKLVDEIEIHFETEEKLMQENHFTGYISHKLEHDRFYRQLIQTADNFPKSLDLIDEEYTNDLRKWFFNHLELKDKKLGSFLNEVGIK